MKLWTVVGVCALLFGCGLTSPSAADRELVQKALDAEHTVAETREDYDAAWVVLINRFASRAARLARENYEAGKESETYSDILASPEYRKATYSTDRFLAASAEYDAAIAAVDKAGLWDLFEETATAPPTPTPTTSPPTPVPANALARQFGCEWIMDTFREARDAGRGAALQRVADAASERNKKFVGTGDAAAAVAECEGE